MRTWWCSNEVEVQKQVYWKSHATLRISAKMITLWCSNVEVQKQVYWISANIRQN